MKHTPILFSTPMVQAILAGRKTQTRRLKCRWSKGDILWVRESFTIDERGGGDGLYYKADMVTDVWQGFWKPSIHMPKSACRIFLEVVEVREEPLKSISEADAIAEGTPFIEGVGRDVGAPWGTSFAILWESIHGQGSWATNPTVVVTTFKVVPKPIGFNIPIPQSKETGRAFRDFKVNTHYE